jgi:putative protease
MVSFEASLELMEQKIELLAPGGDVDAIKAAILAGADAIYCGLDRFNARNRAANLSFAELQGILRLAHRNACRVYVTVNIMVLQSEIPALLGLLNKLANTTVDGVIVQDLGVLYLLANYFKGLEVHASTQLTTHNEGQIKFLSRLKVTRVNLSRELSLGEIKALTHVAHEHGVQTEVFVHGSNCLSFSGLCYMSSVLSGNSGNRGRCSQPCRDRYLTTSRGKNYPLNLKDNSAYFDLKELAEAGVDSLKIEGRIKKADYVYTVVDCWNQQLRSYFDDHHLLTDNRALYKVFNRDYSNGYLKGDINRNMFIDSPRDHSIRHLSQIRPYATTAELEKAHLEFYAEKDALKTEVAEKISHLSLAKDPLWVGVSGWLGTPLKVSVRTPDRSFNVYSEGCLVRVAEKSQDHACRGMTGVGSRPASQAATKGKQSAECLDSQFLKDRLCALNNADYYIDHLDLASLQADLSLSFKDLNSLKKRLVYMLNGEKEVFEPVQMPRLKRAPAPKNKPRLAILIDSAVDLAFGEQTAAELFFQLPDSFQDVLPELVEMFGHNPNLIPWFPAVLIGADYAVALDFLDQVRPRRLVANNTGIAGEADQRGIPWIAGPFLNIANSFSLLCLKDTFHCAGSFISNEIARIQLKSLIRPDEFRLYYSIYHPILLMTSRQCLFQQVSGCDKVRMTKECLRDCQKSASIARLDQTPLFVEKSLGSYPCLYHSQHCLNTAVVKDFPHSFDHFLIDLREVKTETECELDKLALIVLFERLLAGDVDAEGELRQAIHPTTNAQYAKGV